MSPEFNFAFHSQYLTVVKDEDGLLINVWRPIKDDGRRLMFVFNKKPSWMKNIKRPRKENFR